MQWMENDDDRFYFVHDAQLRALLEGYWAEYAICRADPRLSRSSVMLAGNILEGMLLDDWLKSKQPLNEDALGKLLCNTDLKKLTLAAFPEIQTKEGKESLGFTEDETMYCQGFLESEFLRIHRNLSDHPPIERRGAEAVDKGTADAVDHYLGKVHSALMRKYLRKHGCSATDAIKLFTCDNPPGEAKAERIVRNMAEDERSWLLCSEIRQQLLSLAGGNQGRPTPAVARGLAALFYKVFEYSADDTISTFFKSLSKLLGEVANKERDAEMQLVEQYLLRGDMLLKAPEHDRMELIDRVMRHDPPLDLRALAFQGIAPVLGKQDAETLAGWVVKELARSGDRDLLTYAREQHGAEGTKTREALREALYDTISTWKTMDIVNKIRNATREVIGYDVDGEPDYGDDLRVCQKLAEPIDRRAKKLSDLYRGLYPGPDYPTYESYDDWFSFWS